MNDTNVQSSRQSAELINRAIAMDLWSLTDHTKVTRQEFLDALARIQQQAQEREGEIARLREVVASIQWCSHAPGLAATPPCKCSKLKASLNSMRESLLMTQGLLSQARASMRRENAKLRAELATANERAERADALNKQSVCVYCGHVETCNSHDGGKDA